MANKNVNILLKLNDQFTGKMKKAGKITDEQRRAMDKCASSATKFSRTVRNGAGHMVKSIGKVVGALAGVSFAAITAGFVGAAESTEEYRKAMGKLKTAYDAAGYSAETAMTAYRQFYDILGDTDTATEASQLLSKLTRNEQDVSKWTRIAAGVNGTFGDSLPIEGLIESANETARVGKVTGVLADALNWSGIMEDDFNAKLEAAGGAAERNRLIMETLAGTYEGAAEAFYKNNDALIKARNAEVAMQQVTGSIGEASVIAKGKLYELFGVCADGSVRSGSALEYIMSLTQGLRDKIESIDVSRYSGVVSNAVQQIVTGVQTVWSVIQPVVTGFINHAGTLIPLIAGVVAAISSLSIVVDVAGKIMTIVSAIKNAIAAIKAVGTVMNIVALGPIALIVGGIALVIAIIVQVVKHFDKVKEVAGKVFGAVKNFVCTLGAAFVQMKDEIVGAFTKLRDKIEGIIAKIKEFLQPLIDLINKVKDGVKALGFGSNNSAGTVATTSIGMKATGTPYFKGGLTSVNEGGRGEIVNLPNGTQIIPHDVAKKQGGGANISVAVTIQGNVIGNRAFMEQTGEYIANRILIAQGVV